VHEESKYHTGSLQVRRAAGKGHTTRIVSKGESLVFGVALVDARSE
jgi:hypothetical protein